MLSYVEVRVVVYFGKIMVHEKYLEISPGFDLFTLFDFKSVFVLKFKVLNCSNLLEF